MADKNIKEPTRAGLYNTEWKNPNSKAATVTAELRISVDILNFCGDKQALVTIAKEIIVDGLRQHLTVKEQVDKFSVALVGLEPDIKVSML